MDKTRVCLTVCGVDHVILSDKPQEYIEQLGEQLNEEMLRLLRANGRMSVTQAAVVSALSYMDAARAAEVTAENLRSRIQDYLEDAARMKKEAELARHEAERLHRELSDLKRRRN